MKKLLISILLVSTGISSYSQLTVTGELRPRTEYRHGYKSLIDTSQKGTVFTEQRSRLGLSFAQSKYKVHLLAQDIRVWGSQPQLNKTDGLTSMHEAWGEFYFNSKVTMKLGRQEVAYDDERLFGGVAWTQQARSHDAALFTFTDSTFAAHGLVAYNQNSENNIATAYTIPNSYKEMQMLWFNKKIKFFNISFMLLNNGIQSTASTTGTRFSHTMGPYIKLNNNKLGVIVKGYYQTGVDGSRKDVQAYYAGAEISYKVVPELAVSAGAEILSGQSQIDTTLSYIRKNHSFNPLYGTGHKFNGHMDYFYVGNHINSVGLNDYYIKISYKKSKWLAGIDIHYFMANAHVRDGDEFAASGILKAMPAYLGTEADFYVSFTLTEGVSFMAGYSQIFATETLEVLKGGSMSETNNWAFLMISFKPKFSMKSN